jgi:bifunctional N-acetylglucosamine-1-phosphate-uridyltransferase/glucosamine-1-phosphate-acetyltransferase GlmU-like protein
MTGIILAAGKSKRMGLPHSKVLLPLNGRPVLAWTIDLARKANLNPIIVVISPSGKEIKEKLSGGGIKFVIQPEAKGTADAVRVCDSLLSSNDDIFILYGDIPLLKSSTVKQLIDTFYREKADVSLLTARLDDPVAYGRIIRNKKNEIIAITEYRDASEKVRKINEINTGVYVFRYSKLKPILKSLQPSPINGEYYLTTALTEIINQGGKITSVMTKTQNESLGINTPEDWKKVCEVFVTESN